jgi:hypothetical protein
MTTPVTPCGPEAALAFVESRFGDAAARHLDPASRLATARARRITELRRCGELRRAERYGWLSLSGWMLGMKASTVLGIDPASPAINLPAGDRDVLPTPVADDPPPELVTIANTELHASDPRDPLGYRVAELAATASCDGLVEVGGRALEAGTIAASLRRRLEVMSRG